MNGTAGNAGSERRLPRLRFSLLALLILVTLACLALAWIVSPRHVVAEALFQVNSVQPVLLDNGTSLFDGQAYGIFQKSQVKLLKSNFLLTSAVRDPSIAALHILVGQNDPVGWLTNHLEVEFLDGSEVLAIRVRGEDSQAEDLERLVDAVAKAYEKEVMHNERVRRLVTRDAMAKAVHELGETIVKKMSDIESLNKDLGAGSTDSAEVKFKQIDVDVLVDVYRQLRGSLQLVDIEAGAPARIRQIQPAVVSPD